MQTYSKANYNSFDSFLYNLKEEFNSIISKEINFTKYGKGILKNIDFEFLNPSTSLIPSDIILEVKFKQFRSLKSFSASIIREKRTLTFENEEDQKLLENLIDCFKISIKVKYEEELEEKRCKANF